MYCKKCGTQNPDGAAYCRKCGAPLAGSPQTVTAAHKPTVGATSTTGQRIAVQATGNTAAGAAHKNSKLPIIAVVIVIICVALAAVLYILGKKDSDTGVQEPIDETLGGNTSVPVSEDDGGDESLYDGYTKVDDNPYTIEGPAVSQDAFGNGFYDTYTMYGASTKPEIIDNSTSLAYDYSINYHYQSDSGEQTSFITLQTKYDDSALLPVEYVELNADLYAYCLYDLGMSDQEAQDYNTTLQSKMPYDFNWSEDNPLDKAYAKIPIYLAANRLATSDEFSSDSILLNAMYRSVELQGASENEYEYITIRPKEFETGTYLFTDEFMSSYPAITGVIGFNNQKFNPDDPEHPLVCDMYVKKDANGNTTEVLVTDGNVCYLDRFTYNDRNQVWTREPFEYRQGQRPEDVGSEYIDEYEYDTAGRLYRAKEQYDITNGEVIFTYDGDGRLAQTVMHTFYGDDFKSLTFLDYYDTITQTFQYDDDGKVYRVIIEELMTGEQVAQYTHKKYRIYLPVQ